jgi:hypothetical protein
MILPTEPGKDESGSSTSSVSELRTALAQEVARIREDTIDWQGWKRKVRSTTKMFVWLLKGML